MCIFDFCFRLKQGGIPDSYRVLLLPISAFYCRSPDDIAITHDNDECFLSDILNPDSYYFHRFGGCDIKEICYFGNSIFFHYKEN